MKREAVFEQIEGLEFSTYINLASDFRTFIDVLGDQACIRALLDGINSTDDYLEVLYHVIELCNLEIDKRYRHPMDAALAAYLYALLQKHPKIALAAAKNIRHLPNLWWASMMTDDVIQNTQMDEEDSLITDWTLSTRRRAPIIKTDSPTVRISLRHGAITAPGKSSWKNLNSQNVRSQENRAVLR